jgi:quercetin 2,3-dioxygenase
MKRRDLLHTFLMGLGSVVFFRKVLAKTTIAQKKMSKTVVQKTALRFKQAFPGLKGVDIMGHAYPIEPFLVFTEFYMDKPVFGPHPHAGISVMTYMLPDSPQGFINRDSQGDFSFIEPGGMHIMQAGSGMHHDEFPKTTGIETHGFQIWINHADKDRWVTPKSMHAGPDEIPEVKTEDYRVRIVHGSFQGTSPSYQMVTDVTLLHVFLNAGKSIRLPAKEMAFVYGLKGDGTSGNESFAGQTILNFSPEGEAVSVVAGAEGLEFMFATGTPHKEPITYGGPFVMTTQAQLAEAQRRHARGEMGFLGPYVPK